MNSTECDSLKCGKIIRNPVSFDERWLVNRLCSHPKKRMGEPWSTKTFSMDSLDVLSMNQSQYKGLTTSLEKERCSKQVKEFVDLTRKQINVPYDKQFEPCIETLKH
jgi:hypothetical protein